MRVFLCAQNVDFSRKSAIIKGMNELAEIRADLSHLREERDLMDSDMLKRSNIHSRIYERRLDFYDCLQEMKK